MEVIATEAEVQRYCRQYGSGRAFYLFAEDRKRPVRMRHRLPNCWMAQPQGRGFAGTAAPNEYYAFQVALWSPDRDIEDISYHISDLKSGTASLPSASVTCFNLEGINPSGKAFTHHVSVPTGTVQALWFGVDIPHDAASGRYTGTLTLKDKQGRACTIPVAITIQGQPLADRGDSEPWRHSRLRWLNSTLGLDDTPTQPYTDITLTGHNFRCLGRSVTLDRKTALPARITAWGRDVLSAPMRFVIETDQGIKSLKGTFRQQALTKGRMAGCWQAEDEDLVLEAAATYEFDGWVN